ncbi:MAG: methylated-DNA--[protein]-cysteine S-methyltransferase [Candidatus Thorarchaeota archaeon]
MEEIKFFEKETGVLNYIEFNKLNLVKGKDLGKFKAIQILQQLIEHYLSGKDVNLFENLKNLNINLDLEEKFPTEFSQEVIKTLVNSERGEITSYSELGRRIGSKANRAIGNILRQNPLPLIIPCHRVIKKNGEIGGFMGESDKSWQQNIKKKLLEIEGLSNL